MSYLSNDMDDHSSNDNKLVPETALDDTTKKHLEEQSHSDDDSLSWGDRIGPQKLSSRHEVLCYMAAAGASQKQMARDLGLTQSRVSVLMSNTQIQKRIEQIRDEHYGQNLKKRFENAAPRAMDSIEEHIDDKGSKHNFEASRWLIEKLTGKPAQHTQVESDTVGTLLDILTDMKRKGEVIDITASEASQEPASDKPVSDGRAKSKWEEWVTNNVPEAPKAYEKTSAGQQERE